MNSIPWSPVLRYATPLPINRTPVSTVGGPFPPFSGTPDPSRSTGPRSECRRSISSVVRYARPRFHRLFRPSCGRGPSCQPLHVQYSSDGSRSLTMLTTPRGEHHDGGRWRGLGRGRHGSGSPRGEDYEGSLVRLRCEADVTAGPGQQWE